MIWTYLIIAIVLLVAELLYFKIADHFIIIDNSNERSSHLTIVLRGYSSMSSYNNISTNRQSFAVM